MTVLLDILILFLSAGATVSMPAVPGAVRYEVAPVREVMTISAPVFRGVVNIATPDGVVGADCADLPYWEGETRYPCWPGRVTVIGPGEVWLSGDDDGEVVLVVRAYGYPHRLWLAEVAR